jgi:hypothetical protein
MRALRWWPLSVPVMYYLVILGMQPANRWVPPLASTPEYQIPDFPLPNQFSRIVFDDVDIAAWVLRAENAARGRQAGWPSETPGHYPENFRLIIDEQPQPTERYFLEYPPAALGFFQLGLIGSGRPGNDVPLSAGILDAHQFSTAYYDPRPGVEDQLWRSWRHAQRVYSFLLLGALMGGMLLVTQGVGADRRATGPMWLFLLPAMLYYTPSRFDILPAVLVLVSIALSDRKHWIGAALALGLAVALKTYPLVLAPLLLRYSATTWFRAGVWCGVFAMPTLVGVGMMAASDGWPGVIEPLKFQLSRPVEPWWILYDRFIPAGLAASHPMAKVARSGIVLVAVLVMTLRRAPNVESLLRRCSIAVLLFVAFQVFFSPQWWQWIAILLIPLVRTHRGLMALVIAGDGLIYLGFPLLFDSQHGEWFQPGQADLLREIMVWLRGVCWLGIAGILLVHEWRELSRGNGTTTETSN